jgi:hypothetical protein
MLQNFALNFERVLQRVNSRRVVVGLSGGIDSAMSAYFLKSLGCDVLGVYMRNWDAREELGHCPAEQDWNDAQDVANFLQIPLERVRPVLTRILSFFSLMQVFSLMQQVDFSTEYWNRVFDPFVESLRLGFTPNPDLLCNKHIKFDRLFDWASSRYGDVVFATGFAAPLHLARCSLATRPLRAVARVRQRGSTAFVNRFAQRSILLPCANSTCQLSMLHTCACACACACGEADANAGRAFSLRVSCWRNSQTAAQADGQSHRPACG